MKPYYQAEGITLYHGDCAEIEVECDLLVTDPPYGQEFKSGKSDLWGAIHGDDDIAGTTARLAHVLKSLRRGRHVYIFGTLLPLKTLNLCGFTEIIWDKGVIGMGDLTQPWGPQHENINFATSELSKANREKGYGNLSARLRKGSVVRSLRAHSGRVRHHPTEKPVDILRQLIESSSVMGETVYDPFAGSGSTLIAAALEGRTAVGCEFEERYCEAAAKRFEAELQREPADAASGNRKRTKFIGTSDPKALAARLRAGHDVAEEAAQFIELQIPSSELSHLRTEPAQTTEQSNG